MPTDCRARVWNWGGLALTYDDKLLMSAALTLPARYRHQPEDWPRLRWYARRLAIARRRRRIAEQPRVGDSVALDWRWPWTVVQPNAAGKVLVQDRYGWQLPVAQDEWREYVRRSRVTQEAA